MTDVYELPRDQFHVVEPVFAGTWFDRAQIYAVLEGTQEGRVFVDDVEQPAAVLLCRSYDYYVAGDPDAGNLRRFILDAPEEADVFAELYGYCPVGEDWRDALLADYRGALEVIDRHCFVHHSATEWPQEWWDGLPAGTSIVPIDADLAERVDRELRQFIGRFWGGYDRYATHGFGFCAIVDEVPASVAYTIAVGGGEANIDVETAPHLWRRGLSTVTSAAYIDHCSRLGLRATWDTDVDNIRSIATARKLGFEPCPSFWEVVPPNRRPLRLSSGRWSGGVEGSTGITVWSRIGRP